MDLVDNFTNLAAETVFAEQSLAAANGAWMLTATAFVFLMTPAVAFFYGGMCRSKSILNMLMLSAGAMIICSIIWPLWGWSIAYGTEDIGGLLNNPFESFLLSGVVESNNGVFGAAVSADPSSYAATIDVAFQVTFAMITVALISGAIAERVRFSTWLVFVTAWITLVYCPIAHMVWGGGLLSDSENSISYAIFGGSTDSAGNLIANVAPHDFAGGTVVHINAGIAALIIVLIIGKRRGFMQEAIRPHNLPFVMLGAFLLWFGWFGFNAGSAFAANGTAGYSIISTCAASGAAALGWLIAERVRDGKFTSLGAASGMVAGLVAITPAADVISPGYSIILGLIAGAVCCFAIGLKYKLGFDDSLDVVGVHFTGGLIGTIAIGFFAANTGLLNGGGVNQLLIQLIITAIAILYSAVVTTIIVFLLDKTLGWRVSPDEEQTGIDFVDHGETAYDFISSNSLTK